MPEIPNVTESQPHPHVESALPASGGGAPAAFTEPVVDFSVVQFANGLLRHRRWIMGITAGCMTLGAVSSLLFRAYVAESRFLPDLGDASSSKLAGLAAQFGVSIGGGGSTESVQFYSQLVTSREILEATAQTIYRVATGSEPADTLRGTFIELYQIDGDTPDEKLLNAVSVLGDLVSATPDVNAETVGVTTTTRWPQLSEQINRRLLDLVNEFNLQKRQSRARAERIFTEVRLQEADKELEQARARLEHFLTENRRLESSPTLTMQSERLKSEVDFRQQVYVTLAQSFEQARIDEVRNTPVLTIVDRPEGSAIPDRKIFGGLFLGLLVGLVGSVGLVFVRLYLARLRSENPGEFQELDGLRRATLQDLTGRSLWAGWKARRDG